MKKLLFFIIFLIIIFSYKVNAITVLLVNSSRKLDVVTALSIYYSVPNIEVVLFNDTNKNISWLSYYISEQIKSLNNKKDINKIIVVGGPIAISPNFVKLLKNNFKNKTLIKRVWGYSIVGTSTELAFIFRDYINCITLVESERGDVKNKALLFKILEFAKNVKCPIIFSEKNISPCVYILLEILHPEKIYFYGNFNISELYNFSKFVSRVSLPSDFYKLRVVVSEFLLPSEVFENITYNYTTLYQTLQINFSEDSFQNIKLLEISSYKSFNTANLTINIKKFKTLKFVKYEFSLKNRTNIIKCVIKNINNISDIYRFIKLPKGNKILKIAYQNKTIEILINSTSKSFKLYILSDIQIICKTFAPSKNTSSSNTTKEIKVIKIKIYYHPYCGHCEKLLRYLNATYDLRNIKCLEICSITTKSCRDEFYKICNELEICGTPTIFVKYQIDNETKTIKFVGFIDSVDSCKRWGLPVKNTDLGEVCYYKSVPVLTKEILKYLIENCK